MGIESKDYEEYSKHESKYGDKYDGACLPKWLEHREYDGKYKYGKDWKGDHLQGTNKDDYLNGRGGDDKIYGKDGNDALIGGKGNDYLDGGKGSDILVGGKGYDTLKGGEGNDYFAFTGEKSWYKFNWDGPDKIKDFEDNDPKKPWDHYDKYKSDDKLVFCKDDLNHAVKDKKYHDDWVKDGHLNEKYFTDDRDHKQPDYKADHHFVWDRDKGEHTGTLYFDANGEYGGHGGYKGDLVKLAEITIVGKGDLDATDILIA